MLRSALLLLLPLATIARPVLAQDPRLGRVDPLVRQAFQQMQSGQAAEAMGTFDEALRANPDDYIAWYFLGLTQHGAGQLDEALRSHLLAAKLTPEGNLLGANSYYNAACAHSLLGRPERALQYLHEARNVGFANTNLLAQDSDLDLLREDLRFELFAASPTIGASDAGVRVETLTESPVSGGTGGVDCGPDGTLYVADFGSQVWRIDPAGKRTLLAQGFQKAADCTLDEEGHLLQVDHQQSKVFRIAPDGTVDDLSLPGLNGSVGVALSGPGEFYVTNFTGQSVTAHTLAGSTRVLTEGGLLSGPNGIAVGDDGRIYVVNYNDGKVVEVIEDGTQRLLAVLPGAGNGHVLWLAGHLYVTGRRDHRIYKVSPEGEVAYVAGSGARGPSDGTSGTASFHLPNGIAVDAAGTSLFVNDQTSSAARSWVLRRVRLVE